MQRTSFPVCTGTTVWVESLNQRRNAKGEREINAWPGTITKIGRKYFYVKVGAHEEKFDLATLQHQDDTYGPQYRLWANESAFQEWLSAEKKWNSIKQAISENYPQNLSCKQIQLIYEAVQKAGLL